MTIDEAIAKYKEITNVDANCPAHCNISCDKCVQESEQLVEWLEELKFLRQWKSDVMDSFCKYDVSSFEELIANARNKAIDDFLKKLYKIGEHRDFDWEDMYELAEQLKAGGK